MTDAEKWKNKFFRSLPTEYKLFWIYILDECDHAGIWHIDQEVAEIKLGIKLSLEKARGLFTGRVVEFDNGNKWFIPDFLTFQYGQLDPANKMYKSIIPTLEKDNLMGHISPIYGVKDKVKEEVQVKDIFGKSENLLYPIEECLRISLRDDRWVKANKTSEQELLKFNETLEIIGETTKNPADYKRHFGYLKRKNPEAVKPSAAKLTIEDYKRMAAEFDKQNAA